MRRYDNKENFDVERDKYDPFATARNNENINAPAGGKGGDGDGDGGDRKFGNTYGLDTQFLKSLGINEPLVTRVFVSNIDYKVDEKKLLEVFKLAGKVLRVELAIDKDGKSRGFGVVEYDHPVESVQAISMFHNQQLYDRRMNVRLHKANEADMPRQLPKGLKGIGKGLGAGGSRLIDVARNISNKEENNPPALNAMSALLLAAGGFGTGVNNNVPGQLGVGGLSHLQASLAIRQGNNSFERRGLSKMDNDVGFGRNNAFDGSNFAGGRNSNGRSNRGGSDRVPDGDGGFAGNQGEGRGGNKQNTYGSEPMSDTIVIKNLPPNITWKTLKSKFQDVGEVKLGEMRGPGKAIIQFASKWDAKHAVCILLKNILIV